MLDFDRGNKREYGTEIAKAEKAKRLRTVGGEKKKKMEGCQTSRIGGGKAGGVE